MHIFCKFWLAIDGILGIPVACQKTEITSILKNKASISVTIYSLIVNECSYIPYIMSRNCSVFISGEGEIVDKRLAETFSDTV